MIQSRLPTLKLKAFRGGKLINSKIPVQKLESDEMPAKLKCSFSLSEF